jgi:hypothetical protein
VIGTTSAINFPTTSNAFQRKFAGGEEEYPYPDAFITKIGEQPASIKISGRVGLNRTGLGGVTVTLKNGAGAVLQTAITQSDGSYSFNAPGGRNYSVTPSKPGYIFSPPRLSYTKVGTDLPGQNFNVKTYAVSGVVGLGAAGVAGVTVRLSSPTPDGFTTRTTTTNNLGAYSFPGVPAGRDYTVTPMKAGYQIAPTSKSLLNLNANQTAVNFLVKAYNITGRITRAGTTTGIGAVTVTLTSPTPDGFAARRAQTTSTGTYTFTILPAGRDFTIKPVKDGYTFTPETLSITNLSGNIPAGASTNFTRTGP